MMPQSLGVIGGKPNSAHYFIGYVGEHPVPVVAPLGLEAREDREVSWAALRDHCPTPTSPTAQDRQPDRLSHPAVPAPSLASSGQGLGGAGVAQSARLPCVC